MGKMLSVEWERQKFYKAVAKYLTVCAKETAVIIKSATANFIAAAQRYTPPLKNKTPAANIDKSLYSRHARVFPDGRVKVKIRGKNRFFGNLAAAAPYLRIKYRGISRAGWFLRAENAGVKLTAAMQSELRKSPDITSQTTINAVDIKTASGDTTATIINNVHNISSYARIAEAQGYRAAAHSFNQGYKRLSEKLSGDL